MAGFCIRHRDQTFPGCMDSAQKLIARALAHTALEITQQQEQEKKRHEQIEIFEDQGIRPAVRYVALQRLQVFAGRSRRGAGREPADETAQKGKVNHRTEAELPGKMRIGSLKKNESNMA